MRFYAESNLRSVQDYSRVVQQLQEKYISEEYKQRILLEWQENSLINEMRKSPEKTQIEVFRDMHSRLCRLQRQLDPHYHHDKILRDRLLTSLEEMGRVQEVIRQRMPSSVQEERNRIEAFCLGIQDRLGRVFSRAKT